MSFYNGSTNRPPRRPPQTTPTGFPEKTSVPFDLKTATKFRPSTFGSSPAPTPPPPEPIAKKVEEDVHKTQSELSELKEKYFAMDVQLKSLRESFAEVMVRPVLCPLVVWATANSAKGAFTEPNKKGKHISEASVLPGERVALQFPATEDGYIRCWRLFSDGTLNMYWVQDGGDFSNFGFAP